jgi:hypothetical protein
MNWVLSMIPPAQHMGLQKGISFLSNEQNFALNISTSILQVAPVRTWCQAKLRSKRRRKVSVIGEPTGCGDIDQRHPASNQRSGFFQTRFQQITMRRLSPLNLQVRDR